MPPGPTRAERAPATSPVVPRSPASRSPSQTDPARPGGPPAVRLTPAPVSRSVAVDELDLSSGQLAVPETVAETLQPGRDHELRVRLPGLAEGTIRVRKHGTNFSTTGAGSAIRLALPALAPIADQVQTVLVVTVRDNVVGGWVGVGQPGQIRGSRSTLVTNMIRLANALGCLGMTNITAPTVTNEFTGGRINVAVENLGFRLGGWLDGTGSLRLDNGNLSVEGGVTINIPNGSGGELRVRRGPDGQLGGSLRITVAIGPVSGTVVAALEQGFVHIQGTVAYRGERMSGSITLIATDERTARDLTTRTDLDPNQPAVPQPDAEHPARPGRRAWCGWGELEFNLTPWLSGRARVIVNNQAQATIIGEIRPQRELILFPERSWERQIFRVEIRAGYGIPVIAQVYVFAAISLAALARVGPGRIYNMSVSGQFSTDPRVENLFQITGSLNISAFAGLRVRAEGGAGLSILGHDIRAGVALNLLAGIRGYVEATPTIGRRHREGGRPEWFIHGHLEIAAQPFLGFSGELFVEVDAPWWSPCPDKRWTWPLFSLEYPLPGEFGIGADVDYVLGQRGWPSITFGEVDFDSSKFMTDLLHDDVPRGGHGEQRRQGQWNEGQTGGAPGGARNQAGRGGRGTEGTEEFNEPVGENLPLTAGGESHHVYFQEREADATLMVASVAEPVERAIRARERRIPELRPEHAQEVRSLVPQAIQAAAAINRPADQVAAMKVASRNAAAAYRRHGRGRRAGRNNRPSAREANTRVKNSQRQLVRNLLTRLFELTARQNFAPVHGTPAAMRDGGTEPVSIVERNGRASINVRDRAMNAEFRLLLTGPISRGLNRSAITLVTDVQRILRDHDRIIGATLIPNHQVNRLAYRWLQTQANQIGGPLGRIGVRMRVANLERARHILPLEGEPHTIMFTPWDPGRVPREQLYRDRFCVEMDRQLRLQQNGVNRLTVDRWFGNLAQFRMNVDVFNELDRPGRDTVRAELRRRAERARDRIGQTIANLDTEIGNLLQEIAEIRAGTRMPARRYWILVFDRNGGGSSIREIPTYLNRRLFRLRQRYEALARAQQRPELIRRALAELDNADAQDNLPDPNILRPTYEGDENIIELVDENGEVTGYTQRRARLGIDSRQGGERRPGYQLRARRLLPPELDTNGQRVAGRRRARSILQQLLPRVEAWQGLVRFAHGTSGLVVLHNPDQVFGGHDNFPRIPPAPAANDAAAWDRYIRFLLTFVGSARVNSRIGGMWLAERDRAVIYARTRVGTQEAQPINRLNFRFIRDPR
jgi:hypothetical protein